MESLDSNLNYDGVKFYGSNDLGCSWQLKKAEIVLNGFDPQKKYENINEVVELYNIRELINSGAALKSWTQEQCKKYEDIVGSFMSIVGRFFTKINDENFLGTISSVSVLYMDDFWALFVQFKVFERISSNVFEKYLQLPDTTLCKILEQPKLVRHYSTQLADVMRTSKQTVGILVSRYLETTETTYIIPPELEPKDYELIFLRYIESEQVNPNVLQLIYKGQNTKECPISNKLRLKAKHALEEFWNSHKETIITTGYGISVGFTEQNSEKEAMQDGSSWNLTYDIKWFEGHLDYPTILNNFIYLFEMFDLFFRSSLVSTKSQIGVFEGLFAPRGLKFYPDYMAFRLRDFTSTAQTALYYDLLKSHNIDLEQVFKWFFETYLSNEFGVHGFTMIASTPSASYVEKCRCLASEMDGILKQFRMFVLDGKIDRELFEMSSEHMIIGDVPSLISSKYAYLNSTEIENEMWSLFSDQTVLSYTEKTHGKYHTLYQLLTHEKIHQSDFAEWQQRNIQWLNERNVISISSDGTIALIPEIVWVLKDIYEHDVTCVYSSPYPSVVEKMISTGSLRVENTLFTEPEQDYLNFMLNKSEFSNGLDLRNKYIHSTYPQNADEQRKDYMTLLKLMILIITKINDEFCVLDAQKKVIS